jgi:hypothetical protein
MEHRRCPRRIPLASESLARVRLRTGRELLVVNISNTGLLVEGDVRLLPGSSVDLHVMNGTGPEQVRSQVARSYVSQLCADSVGYRAALAFERSLDMSGEYPVLPTSELAGSTAGSSYPLTEGASIARVAEHHSPQ